MTGKHSPYASGWQRPAEECRGGRWDVVLVGGGPSGAACAWGLATRGLAVLVVDKEEFPRHKVCGDLLVPDAIAVLRRMGAYERVAAAAHQSDSIEVASPSGIHFGAPGEYLTLSRKRLDYELLRHAVEAGATAAVGHVTRIEPAEEGKSGRVFLSGSAEPLVGRVVVCATGAVIDVAQRAGIVADRDPSAVAVRCYVRSSVSRRNTIVSYDRSILPGYGWVIPLGADGKGKFLYNVGCGTSYRHVGSGRHNLKRTLQQFMAGFPEAREVMQAGGVISPVAGASLRCGLASGGGICRGNVLGIGETIGTTYPFTGEGIGKGMESGLLAAEVIGSALRADDLRYLEQFRESLESLRPRYRGYEIAERWLGKRFLVDLVARRVRRSRYLQEKVRDFMAETDDPRALFNWGSVIRSFFR